MLKNLIFYFSGTGNSLSVAMGLEKQLGNAAAVPILSVNGDYIISSDIETVGFVYPIYMNAVSQIMREFINRIKIDSECFVYGVATHGGIPGKAGCHLHKVCKEKGININAYFEVGMIHNTPKGVAPVLLMKLDWEKDITKEKITPVLQKAEKDIQSITSSIHTRDTSSMEKLLAEEHGFSYLMMRQLWKMSEHSNPKLQFLIEGECIGCGICEKVCTTNCIKLIEGKPHWDGKKCRYCYACFNFCPVQVIGVKHYTKKMGRYHHPDISWKDIESQKYVGDLEVDVKAAEEIKNEQKRNNDSIF